MTIHIYVLEEVSQHDVKALQLSEKCALLSPHMQLTHQLRHYQECPPPTNLLALEDVTEDVVPNIQHILTLGSHQVSEHITAPCQTQTQYYFYVTLFNQVFIQYIRKQALQYIREGPVFSAQCGAIGSLLIHP